MVRDRLAFPPAFLRHTIQRNEFVLIPHYERKAGPDYGISTHLLIGQTSVQSQQKCERVLFGSHTVSTPNHVVQGFVGRLEGVGSRQIHGAVKLAEALSVVLHNLTTEGPKRDGGLRDRFYLLEGRRLRPGEGIEHGVRGISEVPLQRRAPLHEPKPVNVRL